MKCDFKRSFSRWYAFLAVIAINSFLLSWGVSIRCKPQAEERIHYLVFTYGVEAQKLNEFTSALLPEIRETKISYSDPSQNQDTQRLFTYIYDSVDFYIVPQSWMSLVSGYSCHFSKEDIIHAVPASLNHDLYAFNNTYSGIKIYDKEAKEGVANSFFAYEAEGKEKEDFYLCFPASSCHNGVLGNHKLSESLLIAEALLKV